MSLLWVSWKSCSNRSTANCQFGEGLLLSEAFSPFFRNAIGNSSQVFFFLACFLVNIKAFSLRPQMARGNIPVGVCSPPFPCWLGWEPLPGCPGGLSQHDSSHTLPLSAWSKSSVGSPTGQWAAVKYRFSSWNDIVFSILAVVLC